MKKKSILFALAAVCLPLALSAQKEREITLNEAIAMARIQSVDAAVALNELKTAYWEFRTFRADLLPEVNLTGTLPNYNKSYSSYQNSDGSYGFVRNNTLGLTGDLSIDQNIWLTGGKLSLTSSLDYIKQLGAGGDRHFMSVPVTLQLTQPIFGVNNIKWNRRIEPVRYAEAKAAFITATEEVTMRAITYYFNLLLAKENLGTAKQNQTNADHLYEVALAKRKMGQISENELLQLKLSALNAKAALTEAESDLNAKMFQLRAFLGVGEDEVLNPVLPEAVDGPRMEYNQVLNKALERNSFAQNIRRRQLEADYEVATARGNLRSVKSNRDVVLSKIRQEQINFNQDIFLLVEHFNNQAQQLDIAKEADAIAQQRYKTSIETFLIGKINTLDLNDAQNSKDDARQKHISELYYYWYYYYQIRSLTLWDFRTNTELEADFDEIIRQ